MGIFGKRMLMYNFYAQSKNGRILFDPEVGKR
jgi:hypothetical protein